MVDLDTRSILDYEEMEVKEPVIVEETRDRNWPRELIWRAVLWQELEKISFQKGAVQEYNDGGQVWSCDTSAR